MVIAVFLLLSAAIGNHLDDYVLADRGSSAEIIYADGSRAAIPAPNGLDFGKVNRGDTVVLHVGLPSERPAADCVLAFSIHSTTIEVLYHGDVLRSYGLESAEKGRMIGRQYCFIPIPADAWDDELTIVLRPSENHALKNLSSHLYIYPKETAYALPLRNQPTAFFVSVILLVFGAFGLVACLLGLFGNAASQWIYICMIALLLSLWMICSYGFFTIFGFSEYYWEPLNYIAGFLSAIPALILYADISKSEPKWHKAFLTAIAVMSAADASAIVLNFTNILHFQSVETLLYVMIIGCILMTASYSFVARRKSAANRELFRGVSIFLFTCMIDVCNLIFTPRFIPAYFTKLISLGVLFLFIHWVTYIILDYNAAKSEAMLLLAHTESLRSELALSRIRTMTSQMQPHFLYNALSSIRQIVYEDPDYAGTLISDFTIHLRATIRSMSNDRPVSFAEELRNTKAYVNIEKVRLGDKLTVDYDIQAENFQILPLSIQPLVENAIRHGIFPKPEGGCVTLKSYETPDSWVIRVMDDGAGFNKLAVIQEVQNGVRDSTGLQNLIFRLETLMMATVTIDSKPDVGTDIKIQIPKGRETKS